jgi:hypothetical protein
MTPVSVEMGLGRAPSSKKKVVWSDTDHLIKFFGLIMNSNMFFVYI